MITDEDALAEEDLFILDKLKEMLSGPEVIHLSAAKVLLGLIERIVSYAHATRLADTQGTFVAKRRESHQDGHVT
jgi:hypothetical protein